MDRNQDIPVSKIVGTAAILMFIAPVFDILPWGIATFSGIALMFTSTLLSSRNNASEADRSNEAA
jgi:hypothetical protein